MFFIHFLKIFSDWNILKITNKMNIENKSAKVCIKPPDKPSSIVMLKNFERYTKENSLRAITKN